MQMNALQREANVEIVDEIIRSNQKKMNLIEETLGPTGHSYSD